MPLYHFVCAECGANKQKILDNKSKILTVEEFLRCYEKNCNGVLVRVPKPPGVTKVETLDNGIMTKSVERPAEVERMMQDRKGLDDKMRNGE